MKASPSFPLGKGVSLEGQEKEENYLHGNENISKFFF